MPAPGDQHKPIPNPFQQPQAPQQPQQPQQAFGDMHHQQQNQQQNQQNQQQPAQRMSEFTAREIATLQSRLEKQLGPEYLSARSGPSGQKVHYIAADKVISLANEVFGFNGWSSSIQNVEIDFVDEHPQTLKISVGLSVIVRVTLRDGTYHEDIGYGHIENCKGKAAAFEKAKKEGTTDALKRALRSFGNVLGNCIYDKTYVDRVSKIKAVPVNKRPFSEHSLHRHADYMVKVEAPAAAAAATVATAAIVVKPEASSLTDTSAFTVDMFDDDLLGDFDEADFCVSDEGHPDEVVVREASVPALLPPHQNQGSRNTSPVRQVVPQQQPQQHNNYNQSRPTGNGMAPRPPQTPTSMNGRPNGNGGGNGFGSRPYQQGANNQQPSRPPQAPSMQAQAAQRQQAHANNNNNGGTGAAFGSGEGEGTPWLSARAVAKVGDGDALAAVAPSIQAGHLFNPKAESPSIRKTPGYDHNTSKPIPKPSRPAASSGAAVLASTNTAANGGPAPVPGGLATSGAATHASPTTAAGGGGSGVGAGTVGVATRSGAHHHAMPEPVRRIGAPPGASSPLANRGQFRPPPMKRGPPTDTLASMARPPLADVPSNVSANGGTAVAAAGAVGDAGVDAKRQKLA